MRTMKHLAIAAAAAAALALAGCGGGGSGTPPGDTKTPPPTPTDVSMSLALSASVEKALRSFFPATSQNSQTIAIPAGGSVTRGGVIFTCNSAYDCTVTLKNELDAIVATWMSKKLGTGTALVTAMLPANLDVFKEMNTPNATSVKALIIGGFGANATNHDATSPTVGDNRAVALEGMGLGDRGPMSFADATLRADFDDNGPAYTTDDAPNAQQGTQGESRTAAVGGSTLTSANTIAAPAERVGLTGWKHTAAFSDWGDTHSPNRDGGFETGALVYSNVEDPKSHPFDIDLAGRFVNTFTLPGITAGANPTPYTFSVDRLDADGDPGTDNVNDTVAFTVVPGHDTPGGAGSHVNANAVSGGSLAITVVGPTDQGSFKQVLGEYLGVSGTYTCANGSNCELTRSKGTDNFTLGTGNWRFTPAAGAMVKVPDQDWLAFGVWATTPDDATNGQHRIGVFYDGMDRYVEDPSTLAGTATYKGGAAGYYVDGTDAGFFTAMAELDADFGDSSAAGTLSGRIDNFRDSAGMYLGEDTPGTPNDPTKGGENDWVVMLGSITLPTDGSALTGGITSGSADGVGWGGNWNARLYGAGDQDNPITAPSGVAGNFDAHTGTTAAGTVRAVTGSFGAELQPASN